MQQAAQRIGFELGADIAAAQDLDACKFRGETTHAAAEDCPGLCKTEQRDPGRPRMLTSPPWSSATTRKNDCSASNECWSCSSGRRLNLSV
jgi:hypothetical protein